MSSKWDSRCKIFTTRSGPSTYVNFCIPQRTLESRAVDSNLVTWVKWSTAGCTGNCHADNFHCGRVRKLRRNGVFIGFSFLGITSELFDEFAYWFLNYQTNHQTPKNLYRFSVEYRADSRFAPSQWETALLCNDVSHWLGASIKSVLKYISMYPQTNSAPKESTSTFTPLAYIPASSGIFNKDVTKAAW